MPIQPLAPTRRENSLLCASPWPGWCGSNVPAAISSARNARTSWRSSSHSGGRRIWSKVSAEVMAGPSAGGDERPEFVRAARRDPVAEGGGPIALIAEVVAPGEHAQRVAVQDMLRGETDRAMHLMRDGGAFLRRLGRADFRRRRFEENGVV